VAEFLRRVGPALGAAKEQVGVVGPLGCRHLDDRIPLDAPVVFGGLQDAVEQRAAGHDRFVLALGLQLVLPAAYDRD
jgi:hypothetical protein